MIHRKILQVPAEVEEHGWTRPSFGAEVPVGVNVTVLDYNPGKKAFVIETWLSDLTHDPALLGVLKGTHLASHANSPRIIGRIAQDLVEQDPTKVQTLVQGLTLSSPRKGPIKPIRVEKGPRGQFQAVIDEG